MDKRQEFGRYMKGLRNKESLTLHRASKKLGYKSLGALTSLERGMTPLPIEKIHPIAKLYKVEAREILEKLRECEPELYGKYMTLERDFTEYFMRQVRSYGRIRKDQPGAEIALHHLPFPGPGTKLTLYILSDTATSLKARSRSLTWNLIMIPIQEVKQFVIREINGIDDYKTLLDIFFIILKEYGLSYQKIRIAWIRYQDKQLRLF